MAGIPAGHRRDCGSADGVHLPAAERTGEVGCWIVASIPLGRLGTDSVFWHLDAFSSLAEANAEAGPRSVAVESFDRAWLLTVAEADWRSRGRHVATIGPLPVDARTTYTARYMEATFIPGMTAPTHTHPGPEAWYTISGETCLETPAGAVVGRAGGEPVIVPGGPPMHLTAIGSETRRALVLVLHDSGQAATQFTDTWTPRGLCN